MPVLSPASRNTLRTCCCCCCWAFPRVFHYTTLRSAKLILESGFRMSTQGQGDGGVYFSTLSPASY
jgi:hypothetical protein